MVAEVPEAQGIVKIQEYQRRISLKREAEAQAIKKMQKTQGVAGALRMIGTRETVEVVRKIELIQRKMEIQEITETQGMVKA